jgi:hypothetical protein
VEQGAARCDGLDYIQEWRKVLLGVMAWIIFRSGARGAARCDGLDYIQEWSKVLLGVMAWIIFRSGARCC